jgi:mono/diheme cytochrome c family protein
MRLRHRVEVEEAGAMADWRRWLVAILALATLGIGARGEERAAAERGREALTLHGYLGPTWGDDAYRRAGAEWGPGAPDPDRDPEGYLDAFCERYGLHRAPYPNDGLPMGLRRGVLKDGRKSGIVVDCMLCHGGSIGGQSIVGLGNTRLDLHRLFQEMARANGGRFPLSPYVINSSRGTVNAGMFSAVLLSIRNTDLSMRRFPLPLGANLPEMDTPAWWNLAPKETMYYDGRTPSASARASLQFFLGEKSLDELKALEPTMADMMAYMRSLSPPKYPFPVDAKAAARGRLVFESKCAKCHGRYDESGVVDYPNEVVPLKTIGTDTARAVGMSDKMVAHYNATWFAEKHPADLVLKGYQAPPLRGVWATAPYLHNGSVPTLYHLLRSSERPARFLRPASTDLSHYDRNRVGWTFRPVDSPASLTPEERRSFFDASRFGLGNGGHTFGDGLSEKDRADVIEYLKTL